MKRYRTNIGMVSTFPPTQCGIATYASDIISSVKYVSPKVTFTRIKLSNEPVIGNEGGLTIESINDGHYIKAAEYIDAEDIDIVDIQHEYKIFGKPDGENVLILLNRINKPIVTTLHTVSQNVSKEREIILHEILKRSDRLNVFSEEARQILSDKCNTADSKIHVIPHGVPTIKFKTQEQLKRRKGFQSSLIFVSAGHLRHSKGYEMSLMALHSLKKELTDFHYFILGANHPQYETAQKYRKELLSLVNKLGLSEQVTFVDKYLERKELITYLQMADICLLPYLRQEQSSSGILPLMIACGRPIVSTPFDIARILVQESTGVLSKSFEPMDIARAISELVGKKSMWREISEYNYQTGQKWCWSKLAPLYLQTYKQLLRHKPSIIQV